MHTLGSNSAHTGGLSRRKDKATFVHNLAIDVSIAADSDVPILISGPPHRTLAFARLIVARGRTGGDTDLRVCDVTGGDDLFNAIEGPESAEAATTVLLREVHHLSDIEQAVLADLIANRQTPRSMPKRRVIATSAISLFHRVKQGTFDARLFYLLNAIHIVVRGARGDEPAARVDVLWLPSSNELSRERFRRISSLSGTPSLLVSINDILATTSRRR